MPAVLARPKERFVQRAIVTSLRLDGCIVVHVPNGGARDAREGKALKDDGVMRGMPDLYVLRRDGVSGWLEVKRPGHRPSDTSAAQKAMHEALRARGQHVDVVSSIDEALTAVRGWG